MPRADGLAEIPDDEAFSFEGSLEAGLVVTSAPNAWRLELAPAPRVLGNRVGAALCWMGTAATGRAWIGDRALAACGPAELLQQGPGSSAAGFFAFST